MSSKSSRRQEIERVTDLLKASPVRATIHQKKPWTCVVLDITVDDTVRRTVGFSKVQHPDIWSSTYGQDLAAEKAYKALARKIVDENTPKLVKYAGELLTADVL